MGALAWRCRDLLPAVLVLLVYWPVAGFGFVNYDDGPYFYENPQVLSGLTWENVRWAFGIHGPSMWIPLTWLSHQGMVSVFGAEAGPQHVMNIVLHAANASLLAWWLRRATGASWRALLVASVFAVHPIHVESVAWVTERKDVLAMMFCLLALLCHERRARAGGGKWLALMVVCHALAVMAKPLAVTLPCILLLLDVWPLKRTLTKGLVLEKLPVFASSAVASWLTVLCQQSIGAIGSTEVFPWSLRVANAVTSYGNYLRRLFWPDDLAVFYPYPESVPMGGWLPWLVGLAVVAIGALLLRKRVPALLIGLLWFAGALVPMSGIVQAGAAAMADRYAYLPFVGLYVAVAWGLAAAVGSRREARWALSGVLGMLVVLLAWRGHVQAGSWQDSESLFRRAIAVTENNYLAHNNLGLALVDAGAREEARTEYFKSLAVRRNYGEAMNNLGILEAEAGRLMAAEMLLQAVVGQSPAKVAGWHNLGKVREGLGKADAARAAFGEAIRIAPEFSGARYDLAVLEISVARWDVARRVLKDLLERDPGHVDGWVNLGFVEAKLGREDAAEAAYREAVRFGSDHAVLNLVLLLISAERLDDAAVVATTGQNAAALHELGMAFGQAGRHAEAARHFAECLALEPGHPTARMNLEHARKSAPEPE